MTTLIVKKFKTIMFFTFVPLILLTTNIVGANSSNTNTDDLKETLEKLGYPAKEKIIAEKWNVYLMSIDGFSNLEYKDTLIKLGFDFTQSYSRLNNCVSKHIENEKQYSSAWINDLLEKFDKKYILENQETISFILLSCLNNVTYNQCRDFEKDALYKEMLYREALRKYSQNIINFAKTLDKDERQIIKESVNYAKTASELPDNLLKGVIANGGVNAFLYSTALDNRKNIDPQLKDFFTSHPFFSKPFNIIRVMNDIKKIKDVERKK